MEYPLISIPQVTIDMEIILDEFSHCLNDGGGEIIRKNPDLFLKLCSMLKKHGIDASPANEIGLAARTGLQTIQDLVNTGLKELFEVTMKPALLLDFTQPISEPDLPLHDRLRRCVALRYKSTRTSAENERLKDLIYQYNQVFGDSSYLILFVNGNIWSLLSKNETKEYIAKIKSTDPELCQEIQDFIPVLERLERMILAELKPHLIQQGDYLMPEGWKEVEVDGEVDERVDEVIIRTETLHIGG
jgi:hypothetical protein